MDGGDKGIVCVTGGTGYVASWLIMRLLQHGYSVHTTIRSDPDNKEQSLSLLNTPLVHVDDVASAQIFLLEYPNAKGRYICSALEISIRKMSEFLSSRYPEYQIPRVDSLKEIELKGGKYPSLSSKKLLDTGYKYKYGLEEMYDEAIQCCKQKGFL